MSSILSISELLESRTLLSSAGITQSVLHIVGNADSNNTITVRRTSDTQITVSMDGKPDQVFGQCDTITGIDIKGGDLADRLAVDESSLALGLGVSMEGGNGNDTLIGSNSDDSLDGGAGDDSIVGNGGNDRVAGRDGNDTVLAGAGDDSIKGNGGNDVVDGGAGNDSVWGNDGNDSVTGDDGNDVMYGGNGGDTMLGGAGNDVFHGGSPRDKMDGGTGKNIFRRR
jgi:Ca2+-binding RTX toxin-like protein